MIPRRRKRARMGVKDPDGGRYRSQQYRAWIRGFPCVIAGKEGHVCVQSMAAAHVRTGTDGCKDIKPSDWWTIPLCDDYRQGGAHGEQHNIGEKAFEAKYKIDMKALAKSYWNHPDNSHRIKYRLHHPTSLTEDMGTDT